MLILSIRTDHSLYFSWQFIRVDTVDSAPEDSQCILGWTMLFIYIYKVYVREFEVAKLFHVTHSPTFQDLLLSS